MYKNQSWVRLPLSVLQDERLTKSDILILSLLIDIDDAEKEILTAELSSLASVSVLTVKRSLKRLTELNYISSRRTGRASVYRLTDEILQPKKRNVKQFKSSEKKTKAEEIAKRYEMFTKMN